MRVLIADNQPQVRRALRVLLEQDSQVQIAGEASSVRGLLLQLKGTAPELLLLDGDLPGLALAELLPALRRANPGLRVIILSARLEAAPAALAAGADSFLSKMEPPERLVEVIHEMKGEKR